MTTGTGGSVPRRRFRVPHTLVLLFGMVVLAWALAWVLPAGRYQRAENAAGRLLVVPGTFQPTPDVASPSPLVIFTAIPRGMAEAAEIIFFVFIIGGAFAVLRATGTVDAAIGSALRRLRHRPLLLVVGGVLVFAAGAITLGMSEEYLPFVPILVTLAIALGYDSVVGVGIITVGYGMGYGVATMNPFTVVIAQNIAGLPPTSGWELRLALSAIFLPLGIHHLWRYARRVHADPASSLVAGYPPPAIEQLQHGAPVTRTHRLVLLTLVAALTLLVVGLTRWGWYMVEMSALFVALTVALAAIARLGLDRTARAFGEGAAELTMTALLIGVARAIQVVLEGGGVIDTIVHGVSVPLQSLGPHVAAVGMFLVQSLINLFIPSGSGQAYVTMPIMAPLADVVGVSRQVAVLAYQFGDGFTNITIPTAPVLIGILAIAGIPFERWLRFVFPLMLKVWLVGSLVLVAAVAIGYR